MSDPFSDRYWIEEFQVTEADLDRIEAKMSETSRAYDLTALGQRVVGGRLRYGPEDHSAPARAQWADDESVQLWDPAAAWEAGDHAIVAVGFTLLGTKVHRPFVGEVTLVQGDKASVRIDALKATKKYFVRGSAQDLQKWRRFVEGLVEERRGAKDVDTKTEYVILEHGKRVISQLFDALRADQRFVRLAGHWFLRELALPATEEQLGGLAWAMVRLEQPTSTADLVPLVEPPLAKGDPGLFGLYLAMRESDLFENADSGQRPRWDLAAPPPGPCVAARAAYDPESYEVLCLPEVSVPQEVVERLWQVQLLRVVIGSS